MSSEVIPGYHPVEDYWVGQKVRSGFSVTSYGKTRTNFLVNPIHRALSKEPPGPTLGAGEITWIAQSTKGLQATRCKQGGVGKGEEKEQLVTEDPLPM